jgi:hypothetical protein
MQHAVINNEAFKMQYAECFTGIHRHAINRTSTPKFSFAVRQYRSALVLDAAAQCAHAVRDASRQHANIEFQALTFGIVQGLQNHLSGVVCSRPSDDTDSARGANGILRATLHENLLGIKKLNIINRL